MSSFGPDATTVGTITAGPFGCSVDGIPDGAIVEITYVETAQSTPVTQPVGTSFRLDPLSGTGYFNWIAIPLS